MEKIRRFFKEEEGVTAIEYGLIAALIALVIIGVVGILGGNLSTVFQSIADSVPGGGSQTEVSSDPGAITKTAEFPALQAGMNGSAVFVHFKEELPPGTLEVGIGQSLIRSNKTEKM